MSASFDYERFTASCRVLFKNPKLTLRQCYGFLDYIKEVSSYDNMGVAECPSGMELQRVEHNPKFYSSSCGSVEIMLLKYVVPPLMLLCLLGNLLNLLIYSLSYFDGSSSVHFLRAKAIFNMIFVWSRLLEVIHAWSNPAQSWLEPLFWHTRSYIMTISNISGTMSTWLTLMVTVETVMCVLMPFLFRQYCTKRTTWFFLVITLSLSTLLHLTLVFTTEITLHPLAIKEQPLPQSNTSCWYIKNMYMFMIRSNNAYDVIQKVYYWIQTTVAIIIPTIAMLVCSILIVKQFTFKELGEAFSQRRRCVIRMTVATTVSHLLLEGPATLTHAAVALKAHLQMDSARKKTYLSQAGMRCSRVSRIENERSFVETRLLSKGSNL
ncbi:unnamed protein product [Nippostrongylus brasiliensis]|uniref:G_PROTEIN_RECEP_F1_2 domain-containing protein n=1 Tax=Nippostrongylus brasiliensis TaxID=27835 RepID=A0A158QXT5_NIPBR|nr:unnamed protein product [Nippostrongylus brasiliensis]